MSAGTQLCLIHPSDVLDNFLSFHPLRQRYSLCDISSYFGNIFRFCIQTLKETEKKKESCFNTSNRIENGSKPKLQSVLLSSKIPHVYNNHIGNSDGTCKHAAFQGSFRSAFKNVLTFVDYLPLFSPRQLCSHLLPSHTSSDPEEKFCYFSHLRNN